MLCWRECDPQCDLAACYGGVGQTVNTHANRMRRVDDITGQHSEHSPSFRRGFPGFQGQTSALLGAVTTSPDIGHSAAGIAEHDGTVEQKGRAEDNGASSPVPEQRSPPTAHGGGQQAASPPRAVRTPRNVQQEGEGGASAPFAAKGSPSVERPGAEDGRRGVAPLGVRVQAGAEEQPRPARRAGLASVAPEHLAAGRVLTEPEAELLPAPAGVANTPLPININDASTSFSPVTDLIDGLTGMLAGLTARYLINPPSFLRASACFSVLPSLR